MCLSVHISNLLCSILLFSCGIEDVCKEEMLFCRAGDPCIIRCDAKAACSAGTTIHAELASDVLVVCRSEDSCKDDIRVVCGTGQCTLQCDGDKSCHQWGSIDVATASAFECIGDCPDDVPAPFVAPSQS